jgi:hypothetical protein
VRRVRLAMTAPWGGGYSSQVHQAWPLGEVREVSDHEATYLTSTFPAEFLEVAAEPAPEAPAAVVPPAPPTVKPAGKPKTKPKG